MGEYYETYDPPFFLRKIDDYSPLKTNTQAYDRPDQALLDDLHDRLLTLHGIDTRHVEASSEHGKITLRGPVDSDRIRLYLIQIAENILGVREVINELSVSRSGASHDF